MTTEKISLAPNFNRPFEPFTQNELDILANKLEESIQSKIDEGSLKFTSETQEKSKPSSIISETQEVKPAAISSENPEEPQSPINISNFGFRNPEDIQVFLLSPAGQSLKDQIAAELSFEEKIKEELLLEIHEELMKQEHQRALFFEWLLKEEEEAKRAQDELFELQQEMLNDQEEIGSDYSPSIETHDNEDDNMSLDDFYRERKALDDQLKALEQEGEWINEKYNVYEKALEDLERLVDGFENSHEEDLNQEIAKIQQEADALNDELNQENIHEEEKHRLGKQIKALHLKKSGLQDIHAVKKGEKKLVDADGNSEGVTYKNAAFILQKDQQIKKEDGVLYLLEKGQKWEEMNDFEKDQAKQNFEQAKNELKLVKNRVQDKKKLKMESHIARIAINKLEHLMVDKQIFLKEQAARIKELKLDPKLPLHPPRSTLTTDRVINAYSDEPKSEPLAKQAPTSTPTYQTFKAALIQTLDQQKPATWGVLFRFVKTVQNPRAQEDAEKFLVDEAKKQLPKDKLKSLDRLSPEEFKREIMKMLRLAPVPETTINDLLKNMARFEKDAYQPNVTTEISPVEVEEHITPNPFSLEPKI